MNPIFKRKIAVDAAMSVSMLLLMGLFVILFKSGTNATFSAQNAASQYRCQVDSIDPIRDMTAASNKNKGIAKHDTPVNLRCNIFDTNKKSEPPDRLV